ncbi:ATP-binding protein [Hahella ganghwensis]|uniref:ATP-binding protein n=1 Tax=Hahella ganghwensis TaxID=286420 RepID=UPI000382D385|nr:ATP-binding protein [Hahella ganghwensis]
MTLRKQLIIIGVLLFTLPLAVIRFAMQLEETLRESQKTAHLELTEYIADVLQPVWETDVPTSEEALLLESIDRPIILDGYSEDWVHIPGHSTSDAASQTDTPATQFKLASRGQRLYLLLELPDRSIHYRQPGAAGQLYDQIRLTLHFPDGTMLEHMIFAEGPGQIRADNNLNLGLLFGVWQETHNGSLLELSLPLPSGARALSVEWEDIDQSSRQVFSRTIRPVIGTQASPRKLVYISDQLITLTESLTPDDSRLRLLTADQKLMLEVDRDLNRDLPHSSELWKSLVRRVLQFLVDSTGDQISSSYPSSSISADSSEAIPVSYWENPGQTDLASIKTLYPLKTVSGELTGWLSLEKRTPRVAAVANEALFSIISGVFTLITLVVTGLLGYASWLSWRIRTLKEDIVQSLNPEHRFQHDLRPSRLTDELGDLSRSFGLMLSKLKGYSDYMETFASKLTHECRTPLAIVTSSLQLAEQADSDEERREYLNRANTGARRISKLLTAMRQASQLEAIIQTQEKQTFDAGEMLNDLYRGYSEVVAPCRLESDFPVHTVMLNASPDLLAQAIDKLIENARDFTPDGGTITLGLHRETKGWLLYIENEGPQIPEDKIQSLFEPFISERQSGDEELHLGLGLVIVKLVAEYHGGTAIASNQANGVRFGIRLPDC